MFSSAGSGESSSGKVQDPALPRRASNFCLGMLSFWMERALPFQSRCLLHFLQFACSLPHCRSILSDARVARLAAAASVLVLPSQPRWSQQLSNSAAWRVLPATARSPRQLVIQQASAARASLTFCSFPFQLLRATSLDLVLCRSRG